MLEIIGAVIIVLGALVFVTGALALLRFPDAYTHVSAVGTAGGIGLVLIVVGVLLHDFTVSNAVVAVLIVTAQLLTSAVGSMALARSAYLAGSPLRRVTFNELEDDAGARRA
ncbi:cation:proton antiporter [Demequina aestuarii]|uniref:cation:proton antiporter n=1 Tax=Demequina aestuarii TaxID=327095 RepID=UPI000782F9BD|nr:monovalent cation/H(+) antiporter subunit G [Demequina aestuarii]